MTNTRPKARPETRPRPHVWTLLLQTDRYMTDVLRPVNREGPYQGETTCISTIIIISSIIIIIATTSTNCGSLFNAHSTVEDWGNLQKMKLNEPGRQKLGW